MHAVVKRTNCFLLDCDGVLWSNGEFIENVKETLMKLQSLHKKLVFVTNNSTKSRIEYASTFKSIGIENANIVPATYAAALYLQKYKPHVKVAFVIGSKGLCDELELVGIRVIHADTATPDITCESDFAALLVDISIDAVVVGCDFSVNYAKLAYASLILEKNVNCVFIGTSRDAFDQLSDRRLPGMMISIGSLEASTGRTATIVGKPSKVLLQALMETYELEANR